MKNEELIRKTLKETVEEPVKAIKKICKAKDSNKNKVLAILYYCEQVEESLKNMKGLK